MLPTVLAISSECGFSISMVTQYQQCCFNTILTRASTLGWDLSFPCALLLYAVTRSKGEAETAMGALSYVWASSEVDS